MSLIAGNQVLSLGGAAFHMENSNHEEADTRMVLHIIHAIANGCTSINVRTVDTDVIVILVGKFQDLKLMTNDLDLWVSFGVGKSFQNYSINSICSSLGECKSRGLPIFHALTGSDTTSAFHGKGKLSAWKAWQAYPDVTNTFEVLFVNPFNQLDQTSDHFTKLERFTVVMYDKTSELDDLNVARQHLFCHRNYTMEKLPPTKVSSTMAVILLKKYVHFCSV